MKLFGFHVPYTKRAAPNVADDRWFTSSPFVYLTDGAPITPETAIKFTAVFAAVRVISSNIGALPLITYKRLSGDGKERATKHPLYRVLKSVPNRAKTTGMEFREMLTAHMLLYGNGYAQVIRNSTGEVLELYPVHPTLVTPRIDERLGTLVYAVRLKSGGERVLLAEDMMHLRAFRDSGLEGMSPIAAAEKAIRAGVSLEDFGKNFFEGGAFPSGVLEYPTGAMSKDAKTNLRDEWQKLYGGENRGRKVAVLEAGLTWKPMGIPQSDAQFLEQRRFQVEEIARIYGVPPHLLGDLSRSTNNNIETQSQEFLTYCLLPWLKRWETVIVRDLLDGDDETYFAEFLVDAFLRGDTATRASAHATGRQWGWLSANDVRRIENMNPIGPEGDVYLSPMNMGPAGEEGEDADVEEKPKDENTVKADEAKSAFRGVFRDAWMRVVGKEIGAVKTAARKKGDDFDPWFDEFVGEHVVFAGERIAEAARGFCSLVGGDAEKLVTVACAEYRLRLRDRVETWRAEPGAGYRCQEDEAADYLTEYVLNFQGG